MTTQPISILDENARFIYEYWSFLRGSKIAPSRRSLSAQSLGGTLDYSAFIELKRSGLVRFGSVGPQVSAPHTFSLHGMPLRSLFVSGDRERANRCANLSLTEPRLSIMSISSAANWSRRSTLTIFPLLDSAGRLTQGLAVFSDVPEQGFAATIYSGDEIGLKLCGHETIEIGSSEAEEHGLIAPARMVAGELRGGAFPAQEKRPLRGQPLFQVIDGGRA